jgi:hypothetical protein|tara:strand:+ start:289 stop:582 length:294 start_codon:yes stop_codon:yes gene_type:complete
LITRVVVNEFMSNPEKMTDVFIITKKFKTPSEFSQHIERRAVHTKSPYMDILLEYCSKNDIEIESVNKLLSSSLKDKLEAEAQDLNLLKVKANKLPF